MLSPRIIRPGLRIAVMLLATGAANHISRAENAASSASVIGRIDPAESEGAFRHLRALQAIAAANGGNRAAGTPGYDRSADYVADTLRAAGYAVRLEEFEFPFFEERSPPTLTTRKQDGAQEPVPAGSFRTLSNSGSGDITARLQAVNLGLGAGPPGASTSGCDAADFRDFAPGAVALVRRGTCTFQVKVEHAVAAGAAGVVIMNEGTDGRTDAFSGQLGHAAAVPVVGVSYESGRALDGLALADGAVRLAVDAVTGKRPTRNVVADTPGGRDGSLVVVGAHLDSVPEGPGINDNGSGSAAVLETALRLARRPAQDHGRVRFAFWGAEERGLVGSRHHVEGLSEAERRNISLYINLDMVGSPNFVRYVQGNAPTDSEPAALARREFVADFRALDLAVEERTGGRYGSDDTSFSQKGIATIGLYTGAGAPKSEAQAGVFGGTAGRPYDPCYHRACDTVENINREILEQNTRALMRALDAVTVPAGRAGTP
jgi:Zn-dependent M28 family amino/carboxypeptidase